ncbi:endonuclease/exonuclease/phosphatase family protein [Streptococcus merionis]|uniref:DNA nuclease n=1 Tax=Streptococcus merionis TaxID=400065 RepID=A0A239STT0_9STRE|nr:endonuclease/exonuclease/phosphatase family protein [Streptococcus merionis]SNU88248.1 DNA nuclease [Streptococcus merionis]
MKKKKLLLSALLAAALLNTVPVAPIDTNVWAAEVENAEVTQTSLSEIRASGVQGNVYTVTGKIVSAVNGWGGQGFYIRDDSGAGLYVYPKKDLGYATGAVIQLTGTLGAFNNELQLVDVTEHKLSDQVIESVVTASDIPSLANAQQSTLVTLNQVTVGEISTDKNSNTLFSVTDGAGHSVAVRFDSRTGFQHSDVTAKISQGDVINLTAILSIYRDTIQLKPFDLNQIEVVKKAELDAKAETGSDVTIAQIQGKSHESPLVKQTVTVKNVVVTYVDTNSRFFVQDLNPDDDPATSDGLNVYMSKHNVKAGDVLTLSGVVEEYLSSGYDEKATTDLTVTQLKASSIEKTGTSPVPAPVVLGQDRVAPQNIIDSDGMSAFNPEQDALDFWESLEGILVAVDDAKVLGPSKYKEIYVLPGNTTALLNKVGGITLRPDGNNTEIIPLLLKKDFEAKAGDYFSGRLAGPVWYSYTNYKVLVDNATLPTFNDGGLLPEKTAIVKNDQKLSIASYNIENFSADKKSTSDEKVSRIANSFVNDLNNPDIIGLIEVQDNNGATDDGTTDASLSAKRLTDAIKALGGPDYTYVDIAPENNVDGGAPGGNIRVGFLYNPKRVQLSEKPVGGVNDAVSWTANGLSHSVGRIDPTNPAWASVRKSLAAEFVFQGEKVVVVANHLNSKRGDFGLYGRVQPPTLGSEPRRHTLATLLNQFAQDGLAQNDKTNIVMLGDFNDFEFTQTIRLLEGDLLSNLVSRHDESDRFTYFYQGNNQSLDNILLSNHLLANAEFDIVHVNSPFMEAHGRASDHDPLLVQLALSKSSLSDSDSNTKVPDHSQSNPNPSQTEKEEKGTQTPGTSSEGKSTDTGEGHSQTSQNSLEDDQNEVKVAGKRRILPRAGEQLSYGLIGLGVIILLALAVILFKRNKKK